MNIYIPIPVYVSLSVLIFSACIGNIIMNPNTNNNIPNKFGDDPGIIQSLIGNYVNLAVVINTIFTLLIIFGKFIQYLFFGQLRDIEARNFNDRLWTYVVSKLIFIFAAKEPELNSLLVWGFWFSILCCLKLFSLLSRDRFDYLNTFLPNTHAKIHLKLLMLLVGILVSDLVWFYFSISYFFREGLSNLMLLNFECFTIFFETIQTLIKYSIHLFDMSSESVWDKRGQYIYYTEFSTDSVILAGTCAHLIHIIIIQGFTPTLLHVVMFFYFKMVFGNLNRKITAYRNYCKLTSDMDNCYPNVSEKDLENYNDDCAICRDKMVTAKKLPCGHIFHHSCLRAWLEQHHSCPTCRRSLIDEHQHLINNTSGIDNNNNNNNRLDNNIPASTTTLASNINNSNNNSNSDNSNNSDNNSNNNNTTTSNMPNSITEGGYISGNGRPLSRTSLTTSQYNNLIHNANYIHGLFPNYTIQTIQNDLLQTNNVNRTIDNILEQRLVEKSTSTTVNTNNNNNNNNNTSTTKVLSSSSDSSSSSSSSSSSPNSSCISEESISDNNSTNSNNNNNNNNKVENQNGEGERVSNSLFVNNNNNNNNNNNHSSKNDTVNSLNNNNNNNNTTNSINNISNNNINNISNNNTNNNNNNNNNEDTKKSLSGNKPLEKFSDTFRATSQERLTSLQQRKKSMLETSRKQFLDAMESKYKD